MPRILQLHELMNTAPVVEPLEARIAPAAVLIGASGKTATYTDADGDHVTITVSTGGLVAADFAATTVNLGVELNRIDLTASGFAGADVSVTVAKAATGDGLANVGWINAAGRDLGAVSIAGDLGEITAGDSSTATGFGLKSLSVQSFGRFGLALTAPGNVDGTIESHITGALGTLTVKGDVKDAWLHVTGNGAGDEARGTIGAVMIGGSLIGGTTARSGTIDITGDLGVVKIGRDIQGGPATSSGALQSDYGAIKSVTLGGSLIGGPAQFSGEIRSSSDLGPVRIAGNVLGGLGANSGFIASNTGFGPDNGKIASVTLGGSLLGGAGADSGQIHSASDLGPVTIAHNVTGNSGARTGYIYSGGKLASVTIHGSLIGGVGGTSGNVSGEIFSTSDLGAVQIDHDILGGPGGFSGAVISFGALASITVGGSVVGSTFPGGLNSDSGKISSNGPMGPVKIGGDLRGGAGPDSGEIVANQSLTSLTIGGSVIGGTADSTGLIATGLFGTGAVTVGHDVRGGSGSNSGGITSLSSLGAITIGGSLLGGTGPVSGEISSAGNLGAVKIAHDLIGASISGTTASLDVSGVIRSTGGRIDSVTIGGSIITGIDSSTAGSLTSNATIRAANDIGAITVGGSIAGNANANGISLAIISARGQQTQGAATDVALGSLTVGGRVELANFLAGDNLSLTGKNNDAQIGVVSVGGDWVASNLIAGASNPASSNVNFGDFHDASISGGTDTAGIVSKISSVTIAGHVFGSPDSINAADHYGFVAQQIDALKIAGLAVPVSAGPNNDGKPLGGTNDVTLHEITAPIGSTTLAPLAAKLIGKSTVTYTDTDGDQVTVTLSKPLLTAANVDTVFTFDIGTVTDGTGAARQLQRLNLAALATNGLSVAISVIHGLGGDGLANVGYINDTGYDLGSVTVPGDLGQIDAGSDSAKVDAIHSLSVNSMGRRGLDTQGGGSLSSQIKGVLGTFTVARDVKDAFVLVSGTHPGIGAVSIGGSLLGGAAIDSGVIFCQGAIGTARIGGNIQGGTAPTTGVIQGVQKLGAASIGGSLVGGTNNSTGAIFSATLGSVRVAHDVSGGTDQYAGIIKGTASLGAVSVGGSLAGGGGDDSGEIFSSGALGAVSIGHEVSGGSGLRSGYLTSQDKTARITIGGSLTGGAGDSSGSIFTGGDIATLAVGHDVQGGSGGASGFIESINGKIATLSIGGALLGGGTVAKGNAGEIFANALGAVKIGHDVAGSAGQYGGEVTTSGSIGSVTIGGSLLGGSGYSTGLVFCSSIVGGTTIGGDVQGGRGSISGIISNGSVAIGGSLIGGSGGTSGGIGGTGQSLGTVTIGRDVIGASAASGAFTFSGFIEGTRIQSIAIGGSVIAGFDDNSNGSTLAGNATIAAATLGSLTVKGSLLGSIGTHGHVTQAIVAVQGSGNLVLGTKNIVLGQLTVGGRLERASVLGGYADGTGTPVAQNGLAQLGAITIGGDFVASNIVAGVKDTNGNGFGNADDTIIGNLASSIAKIASISIGGVVAGTAASGDHFGIAAATVGAFKFAGFSTVPAAGKLRNFSPNTADGTYTQGDVSILSLPLIP